MKKSSFIIILCLGINILTLTPLFGQVLGDTNNSGNIDIVDALLVAQHYVGLNPPGFHASAADVNGDGQINIVDALLVAQYYVGLITVFPGQSATPQPPTPTVTEGTWDGETLIIDHTCTDTSGIPSPYIDAVKGMIFWTVGESHSRQIQEGLRFYGQQDETFAVQVSDRPGEFTQDGVLRVLRRVYAPYDNIEGDWGMTGGEQYFWSSPESRASVKAASETYPITVNLWSWCWEILNHRLYQWNGSGYENIIPKHDSRRWQTEHMQIYLDAIREFNANPASDTIFVYQTAVTDNYREPGHTVNGEAGYRTFLLNTQIRQWVRENGGILYDWADIESHSANGTQQRIENWTDNDGRFGPAGTSYSFEFRHADWDADDIGHANKELTIHKAKAVWWMLARIAGWGRD